MESAINMHKKNLTEAKCPFKQQFDRPMKFVKHAQYEYTQVTGFIL